MRSIVVTALLTVALYCPAQTESIISRERREQQSLLENSLLVVEVPLQDARKEGGIKTRFDTVEPGGFISQGCLKAAEIAALKNAFAKEYPIS